MDEGGNAFTSCSGIILLALFIILSLGNIVWIVVQFMIFGGSGCTGNNIQMSLTLVLGIFMHTIVIFRTRKDASVLTSALVLSYNLYL